MAKKKAAKKSAKKAVKKAAKKAVRKATKKVAKKKTAAKKPVAVADKKTTTINPYLTFNGNCEEAFHLYQSVFGGKFDRKVHFKDMPPADGQPPMPEEVGKRIMHVSLPITKDIFLMGSDSNPMFGEVTFGQHLSLSVTAESNAKADKVFHSLAEGGKITMPLAKQFWGAYFGMLIDKFGITWLVSCDPNQK